MKKDFYHPGEIKFNRKTSLWLIQNLVTLREGHWPADSSSYIDIIGRKQPSRKSPFITPVEYAAEITTRMEKCGIDGMILLALECWGESEEALSKYLEMPLWSVRKRANRALSYISSGPARRWNDTNKRLGESYRIYKKPKKKKLSEKE